MKSYKLLKMRNLTTILLLFGSAFALNAQLEPNNHSARFELGNGLNLSFQDSAYFFRIGGMMQPQVRMAQQAAQDPEFFLNSRRTYLNFQGDARKEKISFFLQLDFSQVGNPLLDVWVAYQPFKDFRLTIGQKQNIGNNREMLVMENYLQFPGRSLLSNTFSQTGRELGIFMDYRFSLPKNIILHPQVALTSGDGQNSFGADSRDADLGGFKYSARLDILPLGDFAEGNKDFVADLARESNLKLMVGAAASYNDGASGAVGEGNGDFLLYNAAGQVQLPDYRQLYGDVLVKYNGFSFLGEYGVSSGTNLENLFKGLSDDFVPIDPLLATEISQFLALGSGFNTQLGYVTNSGLGLDLRYAAVNSEFENNLQAVLSGSQAASLGLTKYFKGHGLKLQAVFSAQSSDDFEKVDYTAALLLQLIF
jgi:hypothetical protein